MLTLIPDLRRAWTLQHNMMGIQNYILLVSLFVIRHSRSSVSSCCMVATSHPDATYVFSLSFNCENLYRSVNSNPCHTKGQLRHKEGVRKAPSPWFIPLDPAAR